MGHLLGCCRPWSSHTAALHCLFPPQYKLFKQLMKRDAADYGHLVRHRAAAADGEAPGSAEAATGGEGGGAASPGGEPDDGDDRTPNWCGGHVMGSVSRFAAVGSAGMPSACSAEGHAVLPFPLTSLTQPPPPFLQDGGPGQGAGGRLRPGPGALHRARPRQQGRTQHRRAQHHRWRAWRQGQGQEAAQGGF